MRIIFLGLVGLAAQILSAAGPNIVWIVADDMSPDIGAYGAAGVKTPNLDRLAKEGRRYTRAYASAPVCSASRSAFILGTYQTTTGLHAHDVENPQPLVAPYQHLPALLREAGWFVTNAVAPGGEKSKSKAKTHYNFAHNSAEMFDGTDWTQRKSGQPFFAQFQISEPHRPFPIPANYDEDALKRIELPSNYPDHDLIRRDWYAYLRSVEVVDRRVGAILDQLEKAGVLNETIIMFFADHGRPMPWGKQWLSIEGLQVPLLIRGPSVQAGSVEERLVSLIDLAPTMLSLAGRSIPEWMQGRPLLKGPFPDRAQIFAARDRCGDAEDRIRAVISPRFLMVENFHPELSRLNWSSYKEAGYPGMVLIRELHKSGGLTPLQDRYLSDKREPLELYDLENDPSGLVNVVHQPEKANEVQKLKSALDSWIKVTGDLGALPAASTEPSLMDIQKAKKQDYLRIWKKRGFKGEPSDTERLGWWMLQYGLSGTVPIN